MKQTLEQKIKSMSGYDIVMAMINGLEKEHVKVDMSTYGDENGDTCYGCAATNIICEISGKVFHRGDGIDSEVGRALFLDISENFLSEFELAIDYLRQGEVIAYNRIADSNGFAELSPLPKGALPLLQYDYKDNLESYKTYARILGRGTKIKQMNKTTMNQLGIDHRFRLTKSSNLYYTVTEIISGNYRRCKSDHYLRNGVSCSSARCLGPTREVFID